MSELDAAQKLKRYCSQLERYGETESIHSPLMAMLRRKARKQLVELTKHTSNCTSSINRFWMVGYYYPFQYYTREKDNIMETTTLLTIFCGELQEMLMFSDERYSALWNLYIGDLHRYMPDNELQNVLAAGFYSRAIELDRQQGRAFHVLATIRSELSFAEKLRLMILGQVVEIPYKKNTDLFDFLNLNETNEKLNGYEKLIVGFIKWAMKDKKSVDHQLMGLKMVNGLKTEIEKDKNYNVSMMMSVCRLTGNLVFKNYGYHQFLNCFDVVSNFYMTISSITDIKKDLLSEAISWVCDVGEIFGQVDSSKNENHHQSLPVFMKTKWDELNDVIMDSINNAFESEPYVVGASDIHFLINGPKSNPSKELLGFLVEKLVSIRHPTVEFSRETGAKTGPLLRRINQIVQKRLDIPMETLMEEVNQLDMEDWRPVYVMMDYDTIVNRLQKAREVWDIDDFINILPSNVLDQLDDQKTKRKSARSAIRSLMELQAEGKMTLKKCENERHCAQQLIQSARSSSKDHKHIVAFLCKNQESQEPMEGVTFYDIEQFHKKYLK